MTSALCNAMHDWNCKQCWSKLVCLSSAHPFLCTLLPLHTPSSLSLTSTYPCSFGHGIVRPGCTPGWYRAKFRIVFWWPTAIWSSEFNIDNIDPQLRDLGHSSDLDPPTRGSPPPHTPNRCPHEESIMPRRRKRCAEATQLLLNSVDESLDLCHGDQQKLEVFSWVSLGADTTAIR